MAKHILLVDDDALLRRSLAFNLAQADYRVSTAASAEDALAMARQEPIDLVLLDIGLPGKINLSILDGVSKSEKVVLVGKPACGQEQPDRDQQSKRTLGSAPAPAIGCRSGAELINASEVRHAQIPLEIVPLCC